MSRPFAVFDIDGTIIRWQLYHALGDQLAKWGHISPEAFTRVRQARMDWKRRAGEDSFQEYEMELVGVFDQALAGLKVSDFTAAVDAVFDEYKDQVYTYTRDLIHKLQGQGYLLFAISVSPSIIVDKLAGYYGFDDFAASKYLAENSRFTGTTELSLGKKPQLLQQLIKKHGANLARSIAVGDSEGDITMLESVEQPIAFNPSKKLFLHACKQGWQIVVERKNVVYKLESHNDTYQLDS
jgi:HAD superfamily hydrolase (TIGR01490 family)